MAPAARPEHDTAAYDLYLQGLYLSNKSDEENLRKSLSFFQQALDKDPSFARAWTGIAKAWDWQSRLAERVRRQLRQNFARLMFDS